MKNVFIIMLTTLGCLAATNRTAAQTPVESGTTGDCTWTITGTAPNYTLTITGTGAMDDYTYGTSPWYSLYRPDIKALVIGDGVTHLGNYAFYNCTALTGPLNIPGSVTTIGNGAFLECRALSGQLTIPGSVTTIGNEAFGNCYNLTGPLTIPPSVTTIRNNVFNNCSGLTEVNIPAQVTTIGSTVFLNCTALTAITVDSNNPNYSSDNGVLFNKAKQSLMCYPAGKTGDTYEIPASVTSLADRPFYNCSYLTSITVAASNTKYTSIDGMLLQGDTTLIACPTRKTGSLTIPSSVKTIYEYAFYNCSGLTGPLNIPPLVKTIKGNAFYN